jgi:hypothetical protein
MVIYNISNSDVLRMYVFYEISGSYDGEFEDGSLLGYSAM